MPDDVLLYFGDCVKALDDKGRVGGYLVRFKVGDHKDLSGDYFTVKSYLGPNDGDGQECIFEHGFPILPDDTKSVDATTLKTIEALADRTFKPLKTKRDAIGIWAETVLNIADDYEKAVFGAVKAGKIGWSSGAPGHRVKRADDGWLSRWPIAEGSLTPRPMEPLNRAITVKSLAGIKLTKIEEEEDKEELKLEGEEDEEKYSKKPKKPMKTLAERLTQYVDDLVDDGRQRVDIVKSLAREAMTDEADIESILKGEKRPSISRLKALSRGLGIKYETLKEFAEEQATPKSLKGMFEDQLEEQAYTSWQLWNVYCDVVRKLAMAAAGNAAAGTEFDLAPLLEEATNEYHSRLVMLVQGQIEDYVETGGDREFYLKALINPSEEDILSARSIDIDDHSSMVVSATKGIVARYKANHGARVKAGRVLSEKNRSRLMTLVESMQGALNDCQALLEESKPMADETEKRAMLSQSLRLQHRARQLVTI